MIDDKDLEYDESHDPAGDEGPSDQKIQNDTSESPSVQGEEEKSSDDRLVHSEGLALDDRMSDSEGTGTEQEGQVTGQREINVVVKELDLHFEELTDWLTWKEKLKLHCLDEVVHETYYDLWRTEANQWFRLAVVTKSRRNRLKKRGSK